MSQEAFIQATQEFKKRIQQDYPQAEKLAKEDFPNVSRDSLSNSRQALWNIANIFEHALTIIKTNTASDKVLRGIGNVIPFVGKPIEKVTRQSVALGTLFPHKKALFHLFSYVLGNYKFNPVDSLDNQKLEKNNLYYRITDTKIHYLILNKHNQPESGFILLQDLYHPNTDLTSIEDKANAFELILKRGKCGLIKLPVNPSKLPFSELEPQLQERNAVILFGTELFYANLKLKTVTPIIKSQRNQAAYHSIRSVVTNTYQIANEDNFLLIRSLIKHKNSITTFPITEETYTLALQVYEYYKNILNNSFVIENLDSDVVYKLIERKGSAALANMKNNLLKDLTEYTLSSCIATKPPLPLSLQKPANQPLVWNPITEATRNEVQQYRNDLQLFKEKMMALTTSPIKWPDNRIATIEEDDEFKEQQQAIALRLTDELQQIDTLLNENCDDKERKELTDKIAQLEKYDDQTVGLFDLDDATKETLNKDGGVAFKDAQTALARYSIEINMKRFNAWEGTRSSLEELHKKILLHEPKLTRKEEKILATFGDRVHWKEKISNMLQLISLHEVLEKLLKNTKRTELEESEQEILRSGIPGLQEALAVFPTYIKKVKAELKQKLAELPPVVVPKTIVEVEEETKPALIQLKAVATYYQYADKKRTHFFKAFRAEAPKELASLQNYHGDALKAKILADFKKDLEEAPDTSARNDVIEAFKNSPKYGVLAKGQGLCTRMFRLETDSLIAFNNMCEEAHRQEEAMPVSTLTA